MGLILNKPRRLTPGKKAFAVKAFVLLLALLSCMRINARQDIVLSVKLDESTIIGNDQHVAIYYDIGEGLSETQRYDATNPRNNLYQYEICVETPVWNQIIGLRMDFYQAVAGDHIYIESISVKQPFFRERVIDNNVLLQNINIFANMELHIQENHLLDIETLSTNPQLYLPVEVLKDHAAFDPVYVLYGLALLLVGMALVRLIPNKLCTSIFDMLFGFFKSLPGKLCAGISHVLGKVIKAFKYLANKLKNLRNFKPSKKTMVIKGCVLLLVLFSYVSIYAMQDIVLSVKLDESTLIRNNQSVTASYDIGGGFSEDNKYVATNPYYSIYEYKINVEPRVWNQMAGLRLDINQVRIGDHIYIESVSVKQPFFRERVIDNNVLFQNISLFQNAEMVFWENNLIDVEITAMHPNFHLPVGDLKERASMPDTDFIKSVLLLVLVGAVVLLLIPDRLYAYILEKSIDLIKALETFRPTDVIILLVGVFAFVFYNLDDRIRLLYSYTPTVIQIAFLITVFFFSKSRCKQAYFTEKEDMVISPGACYLILLALSLIVYVPAVFPNPYFHNDERLVILTALGFLETGDFVTSYMGWNYPRAWPHTFLVAQTIRLFGFSTVTTRALSTFLGIVFVVSVFYILKKLTRRTDIPFFSAILVLFNQNLIEIFTTVRMYALMMPLSIWMLYFIYKAIHCEISYKSDNMVTRFLTKRLNFHFGYAAVAVLFIYINERIMINSITLLLGVVLYIFWTAITERQPKFISLSVIGVATVALAVTAHAILSVFSISIPFISHIINSFLRNVGVGSGSVSYFWEDVNAVFGPLLGVVLLSIGLVVCIGNKKATPFFRYAAICYLSTTVFFVFFADRFYGYRYMAFIVPFTAMLFSVGFLELASKLNKSACLTLFIVGVVAIGGHMVRWYPYTYIEKPERSKYDRPYQILENDAQNEGLSTVSVYTAYRCMYFEEFFEDRGEFNGLLISGINQIDNLINTIRQPVMYFFAERQHLRVVSKTHKAFLEAAVDKVTDVDNTLIYKYHFIEAVNDAAIETGANTPYTLRILDVRWENDVAYLDCELYYTTELSSAIFAGVEIVEDGLSQSATHRYQVLLPDGFSGISTFTLPVRPKTEEPARDLNFKFSDGIYVYLGQGQSFVHSLTQSQE